MVGRVVFATNKWRLLSAQSIDDHSGGIDDWEGKGNEYKNEIKEGLRIAKKQQAPDLILIPVQAPEAG